MIGICVELKTSDKEVVNKLLKFFLELSEPLEDLSLSFISDIEKKLVEGVVE